MVSFVDNPQEYGREREEEKQRMMGRLSSFYRHYDDWIALCQREIPAFAETFHERLDAAFEHLKAMTLEILGCTDEELNAITLAPHASAVIRTIKGTQTAFDSLRLASSNTLNTLCNESQQSFAERTDLDKLKLDLQDLIRQLSWAVDSVERERCTRWNQFNDAQHEFERYERMIREYDDLNFFEQLVTPNAHDQYGNEKNRAEQERNARGWAHTHMRELKEHLDRLLWELKQAEAKANRCLDFAKIIEDKIVDAKTAATEVYSKTYDLENFLTTRDIEFSVEEAVRHILQLLYTSIAVVDSDVHVKGFKALILAEVAGKYGVEKTEELKQNRGYIEYYDPLSISET